MWICACNPFNEAAVKAYLGLPENHQKIIDLMDVYKACSGGKGPQCGTCYATVLNDMVKRHNDVILKGTPQIP